MALALLASSWATDLLFCSLFFFPYNRQPTIVVLEQDELYEWQIIFEGSPSCNPIPLAASAAPKVILHRSYQLQVLIARNLKLSSMNLRSTGEYSKPLFANCAEWMNKLSSMERETWKNKMSQWSNTTRRLTCPFQAFPVQLCKQS